MSGTGYFADSGDQTEFIVHAENLDILLADPVTTELYNAAGNASFAMTVQAGAGTVTWGGRNVLDANGGATVTFASDSKTVFLDDFTLGVTPGVDYRTGSAGDAYARASATNLGGNANANDLTVKLEAGASLVFSSSRDTGLTLFDFTGSTSENKADKTLRPGSFHSLEDSLDGVYENGARQAFDRVSGENRPSCFGPIPSSPAWRKEQVCRGGLAGGRWRSRRKS